MNGNDEMEQNEMEMDGNEWIQNIDAKENENKERVVMRVMELKQEGKEDGIMNGRV